jgi:hypothetical protein
VQFSGARVRRETRKSHGQPLNVHLTPNEVLRLG